MIVIIYSLMFALLIYAIILIWLAIGFSSSPTFISTNDSIKKGFTIIICARNEEKKIGKCLRSILDQDYDLTKIQLIIVNDASTDSTVFQAQSVLKDSGLNYQLLSNATRKGKKQSITYAMQFVQHEIIISRDADTFTRSFTWLQSISDFYTQHQCDLIIAPVAIADNAGILWALQAIENNVLTVLNCGSTFYKQAFLASGANLIFTKEIFLKTNGYQNHINTLSGDDVLFLEDIKKIKGSKIKYLKSAESIVYTYPCLKFQTLLDQKTRWASKFKINSNKLNSALAIIGFAANAGWLFCLFYALLMPQKGELSLIFVLLKLLIDFLLLFLASRFIKNKGLIWYVLPVGCVYPIYTLIIALRSVFLKPNWK